MRKAAKICGFTGEGLVILAYIGIAITGLIGNLNSVATGAAIFGVTMLLALILLGLAGMLGLISMRHTGHRS